MKLRSLSVLITTLTISNFCVARAYGSSLECSEKAVTETSTVFSREAQTKLQQLLTTKVAEMEASFEMKPPKYSTEGWLGEKIQAVQSKVAELVNSNKEKVKSELQVALTAAVSDIQAQVAKDYPYIRFESNYTYVADDRSEGSWSTTRAYPIGHVAASVTGGVGFSIGGEVGLGVAVTVPAALYGKLVGKIEIKTPGSVDHLPPKTKPSLKVSTEPSYDLTYSFEMDAKLGFTIVVGKSHTVTIPSNKAVSATLDAGKGYLLYPAKDDKSYDRNCGE